MGCQEPDCSNKEFRKTGLCQTHYRAQGTRQCEFPGCEQVHRAIGLCATHYSQHKRGLELVPIDPEWRTRKRGVTKCSFPDCGRQNRGGGLCTTHKTQADRGLELQPVGKKSTGPCELCGEHRGLVWDHDHETGKFRGWLCTPCNTALGRLGDNEAGLLRALAYLKKSDMIEGLI